MHNIYTIIKNNHFFKPLLKTAIILFFLFNAYQILFYGHIKASAQRTDCVVLVDGTNLANGDSIKVRPGKHIINTSGLKAKQSNNKIFIFPLFTKTIDCPSTVLDKTAIITMTLGSLNPGQTILSQEFFKDDSWFVAYLAENTKVPKRIIGAYSNTGWSVISEDKRASMPVQVQRFLENEDTNE